MLEGREFTIFTDHKPITYAFQQDLRQGSPRQFRHLEYIGQFSTDIQHISGKQNVVADALSRVHSVQKAISMEELACAQETDEELRKLLMQETALNLKKIPIPGTDISLYCDTAVQRPRPFVTSNLRRQVFDSVHGLSHPGVKTSARMVA